MNSFTSNDAAMCLCFCCICLSSGEGIVGMLFFIFRTEDTVVVIEKAAAICSNAATKMMNSIITQFDCEWLVVGTGFQKGMSHNVRYGTA